jgi:hypothetical protein
LYFYHLPQIHELNDLKINELNHMDLGTPPETGGETVLNITITHY